VEGKGEEVEGRQDGREVLATKVMRNYTNHIAHTQLDKFMRGNEWIKPDAPASPSTRALDTVL
jgi:hypothetical protein